MNDIDHHLDLNEESTKKSKRTPLLLESSTKIEDENVVLAMEEEEKEEISGESKIVTVKKKIFRGDTRVSPGEFYRLKALTHDLNKIKKKMSVQIPTEQQQQAIKKKKPHTWLYSMLSANSQKTQARYFKNCITVAICLTTASFIFSTEPKFESWNTLFDTIEAMSSSLFLIELLLRAYVITESRKKKYHNKPIMGRLRFLIEPESLVDLLSSVPYFVELAWRNDLPTLTWLRMFRLFRLLKTNRYAKAFNSVYRVVWFNREMLSVLLLLCFILMLTTATFLYYIARADENLNDTHGDFGSIPSALYVSTMMLTGQGGPDGDIPWYVKVLCGTTAIFGVAFFVLPASILVWSFEAEAERLIAKDREERLKRKKMKDRGETPITSSSADSDKPDGAFSSDAWEAYEKVILGDVEDDDKKSKDEMTKKLFDKMDVDRSGKISREEMERRAIDKRSPTHKMRKRLEKIDDLFRDGDLDNSGDLSPAELEAYRRRKKQASMAQRMQRMETKLDTLTRTMERLLGKMTMEKKDL